MKITNLLGNPAPPFEIAAACISVAAIVLYSVARSATLPTTMLYAVVGGFAITATVEFCQKDELHLRYRGWMIVGAIFGTLFGLLLGSAIAAPQGNTIGYAAVHLLSVILIAATGGIYWGVAAPLFRHWVAETAEGIDTLIHRKH